MSNLDSANSRFSINALVVDYSAAVLDNFPGGQISNGDFVEAKGTALDGNGALSASRVEFEDGVISGVSGDLNVGDYLEIRGSEFPAGSGQVVAAILEREDVDSRTILQGFVETAADPAFAILGVTVTTNGATVFRDTDDSTISATEFFSRLSAGSLVKARGTETSSTAITADEVEFELEF